MHLLARTNTEQENSDHLPSSDAPAVLGSSARSGTKIFWLAALVVISLGMLPSAVVGMTTPDPWPPKPTLLEDICKGERCFVISTRIGCASRITTKPDNCEGYCRACRTNYRKSACPNVESWNYCTEFVKHYFGCNCYGYEWYTDCNDYPGDRIQVRAIPKALVQFLVPNYQPKPKHKPPATGTFYCAIKNVVDATATECSTDAKGPVKLKCKEGNITCKEKLMGSKNRGGPAVCYKADNINKDGVLDLPFTDCVNEEGGKPATTDDKPATTDDKPVVNDNKPTVTDNKPAVYDNKPAATDNKPVAIQDKRAVIGV